MVVDLGRVAALCLVAFVIISVPGPSMLFVVSRGVALGRSAALATVGVNHLPGKYQSASIIPEIDRMRR